MLASDKIIEPADAEQNDIFKSLLELVMIFFDGLQHAKGRGCDISNGKEQCNAIVDEFNFLTLLFKQANTSNTKIYIKNKDKLLKIFFNMSLIVALYDDNDNPKIARIYFYNYTARICEAARKFGAQLKNYQKKFPNHVAEESMIQTFEFTLTKGLANIQLYSQNYQLAEAYFLDYVEANQNPAHAREAPVERLVFNTNMANSHLLIARICVESNEIEKADTNIQRGFNALSRLRSKTEQYETHELIIESKFLEKVDELAKVVYKKRDFIVTKRFYQRIIDFINNLGQTNKFLLKEKFIVKFKLDAEKNIATINKYIFDKIIKKFLGTWFDQYSNHIFQPIFNSVDYRILLIFKYEKTFLLFLEKISNELPDVKLEINKIRRNVTFKNITAIDYNKLFHIITNFSEKHFVSNFIENTEDKLSVSETASNITSAPTKPTTESQSVFYLQSSQQLSIKKIKKNPITKSTLQPHLEASYRSKLVLIWPIANITYDAHEPGNVVPLSSTYIPDGSYFGYIDPRILEKLPAEKKTLGVSLEDVLRRGKLVGNTGQGVKFIKKELRKTDSEYIYKIKPLGTEGDHRLLGRIAETIIDANNKHRHLIVFDLLILNAHKESSERISLYNKLGNNVISSPAPSHT